MPTLDAMINLHASLDASGAAGGSHDCCHLWSKPRSIRRSGLASGAMPFSVHKLRPSAADTTRRDTLRSGCREPALPPSPGRQRLTKGRMVAYASRRRNASQRVRTPPRAIASQDAKTTPAISQRASPLTPLT